MPTVEGGAYTAPGSTLIFYWEDVLQELHETPPETPEDTLVGLIAPKLVPIFTQPPVFEDLPQREWLDQAKKMAPRILRLAGAIGAGVIVGRALAAADPEPEKSSKLITIKRAVEIFDEWFFGEKLDLGIVKLNGGASFFFPARVAKAWRDGFVIALKRAALPQEGHSTRIAVFKRHVGRPSYREKAIYDQVLSEGKQARIKGLKKGV